MRKAWIGFTLEVAFLGIIGYADDIILLASSRAAAKKMIEICERFASENNISFSVSNNPIHVMFVT